MIRLAQVADQAIHHLQLNTRDAVKFVESQVSGVSRSQVLAALVDSMVFHKAK